MLELQAPLLVHGLAQNTDFVALIVRDKVIRYYSVFHGVRLRGLVRFYDSRSKDNDYY